jgi:transposase
MTVTAMVESSDRIEATLRCVHRFRYWNKPGAEYEKGPLTWENGACDSGHTHSRRALSRWDPRHRSVEFRKFLATLDKQVPGDLDAHLVCDHYATHKTDTIQRWLAAHPRFHVHFVPTSSSWLDQVERWFAELTTKLLQRGVHTSVPALEADIRAWIDTWNQDPKPFVWTKSADEILSALARYCQRIPGADTSSLFLKKGRL